MLTGRELMARAKAGDVDAFAELYARYRPEVLSYARGRHPGMADDITQDVFVRALGCLHLWRDQGRDPGAWLQTITANICRDRAKSAAYRLTTPVAGVPERPALPERTDPGLVAVAAAMDDSVAEALRELPERRRQALVLFYLHDLPVAEVAARMGVTRGHVRVLLYHGRRDLGRVLIRRGAVADG